MLNWSGNPIPRDSFKNLDTSKNNQKASYKNPISMKPKHPAPPTS